MDDIKSSTTEIPVTFSEQPSSPDALIVNKKLAEGKFSVYKVHSRRSRACYALKMFPRNQIGSKQYKKEKLIFRLKHRNVIQHVRIKCHDKEYYGLLTEYAKYGDFFEAVLKGVMGNELLVRTYFHHLIEGVEYIHSQGVAHLDLKLENLMLGPNFVLKIIDFDQAQPITDTKLTSAGTPGYRAPEVIEEKCSNLAAADIYSAAIILYALRAREFPFLEQDDKSDPRCYWTYVEDPRRFWQMKAELRGDKEFFSPEFIELINGMVNPNPERRYTIKDIKASKWYRGRIIDPKSLTIVMKHKWKNVIKQHSKL